MNLLRRTYLILIIFLSIITVLASLLSLIYDIQFWVLKVLDFPRLQLFLASLFLLVLLIILLKEWNIRAGMMTIFLVASALFQAYFIFPYTSFAREEVKGISENEMDRNRRVRLMLANVYMENRNYENLLKLIEEVNSDIILLVEINAWWAESLGPVISNYPNKVIYPLENTY